MPSPDALTELLDEQRIRALAVAYAGGADRRDGAAVAALFVEDGLLEVRPVTGEPRRLEGRDAIATAIASLSRYLCTTHFLGQHAVALDGDQATGEVYCQAHHLIDTDQGRQNRTLWIRYQDRYVRSGEGWRIATRCLQTDWSELRPAPPLPDA